MAFDEFTETMIVSIASQKGGTGNTSTSISLSAGLAHKGSHRTPAVLLRVV
jgi:cellulose biosynthesis protein BcsQ